jgi:hypothetical protein
MGVGSAGGQVKANHYALIDDTLQEQPLPAESLAEGPSQPGESQPGESWYDVSQAEPGALQRFLAPLTLHPLVRDRCLKRPMIPASSASDS